VSKARKQSSRKERRLPPPKGREAVSSQGASKPSPAAAALQGKRPILRFVLIFGVIVAAFYAFTSTRFFQEEIFTPYLKINARVSSVVLNALDYRTSVDGTAITGPFSMDIHRGCEAIEPSVLFLAAIAGAPAPWRRKLIGAAAGVLILAAMNLVRILTLYHAGRYHRKIFDLIHVEIWQPAFILFALLLWLGWAVWATGRKN
jgi:exosortase H (IPTLxxWG-CTERM-specific)